MDKRIPEQHAYKDLYNYALENKKDNTRPTTSRSSDEQTIKGGK